LDQRGQRAGHVQPFGHKNWEKLKKQNKNLSNKQFT
jgi:hypothetical protein